MAIKPKSFEEFYSRMKDVYLDVDIVADYAETHDGDLGEFNGNMLCPECRVAELSFVHKTSNRRAHLRRNKSSSHKESCSYYYDYASNKLTKEFVDSLSYNEIQDKLNSIMSMLCKTSKTEKNVKKDIDNLLETSQNPMLINEKKGSNQIFRAIRRKNLKLWIDESDGEDFSLFFGEVKLQVVEKEKNGTNTENSYKYNLLYIYTKNKKGEWKFRTSLYRGAIKDRVNYESIYNIVLIGKLEFKFKPFTIKLANNNAIKFREL